MENKINIFNKKMIDTLNQNDSNLSLKDLKGNSVIFVIDMTNGFCKNGNLASPLINEIIMPIKELLKKAIENKIEIIALTDAHNEKSPEFKTYPIHCLENTIESQLVQELQFSEIKIIKKNSTNGFFVLDTTKEWLWDNIIIVGCCTDICIYQFALSCKTWSNQQNKNVNVIVPKSLTSTFDTLDHPSAIINNLAWYSMLKNGIKIIKNIN